MFLPLVVAFGVPVLALLVAVVFGGMYVPLQWLNGKWLLCCCCPLRCCHRRFKRLYSTADTVASSQHVRQLDLMMLT